MALSGTLKDFGIADILQLIGQQAKTGVLYVSSRSMEVEVSFVGGNIARAVSRARRSRDLLGAMLVRRGLVSEEALEKALEVQARTLKRLGDILVAQGRITSEQLRQMMRLQTTETLYELFTWKTGTYEFVQQDVEHDPTQSESIRPEAVLMEGFRRIDEWPLLRKVLPSTALTFERIKALSESDAAPPPEEDAFDAFGESPSSGSGGKIGPHELLVYRLAQPGQSVQRICDLSGLGEFETCKALVTLVEAGYLQPVSARMVRWEGGPILPDLRPMIRRAVVQTSVGLLVVGLLAASAQVLGLGAAGSTSVAPADPGGPDKALSISRMTRLRSALDVYRLRHGRYPEALDALVSDRLLGEPELRFPFDSPYHYRRTDTGYLLLPPVDLSPAG